MNPKIPENTREPAGGKKVRFGSKTTDGGDVYEGKIVDNKFEGETTVYYLNKCFFSGEFANNEKKIGVETFPNGDYYEGEFLEGKFHGHGLLANNPLKYLYQGDFKYGKKHGLGTEEYEGKSIYKGQFFNNYRHGRGRLEFPNGAYYEGSFKDGVKHGYGIDVTANLKNGADKAGTVSATSSEDSIKFHDECYEGEFVQGQRHGVGREYKKDGSYFYGFWQCNEKVGEGLFYFAESNNWMRVYFEKKLENSKENFTILEKNGGVPPLHLDCSKSLIEDCAVIDEKIQDVEFPPNKESLYDFRKIKAENFVFPNVVFVRLAEIYQLDRYDLFSQIIRPNSFVVEEGSNLHIIAALESLCYYPHLLENCITQKCFEDLGYFIVKFYLDGTWKEIFVDDFIPCSGLTRAPILTLSLDEEIGWLVLQKAIAKQLGGYFVETSEASLTPSILQMLTGRCLKTVNITSEEKLFKCLKKYESHRVKIGYLYQEAYEKLDIKPNTPYMILDFFPNELLTAIIIVKTFQSQATLPHRDKTSFFSKSQLESQHNPDDPSIIFMGLQEFMEHFSDINILLGVGEEKIQNINVNSLTTQDFYDDGNFEIYRFYQFSVNRESNVLFNFEQLNNEENKKFALRVVLAQKIKKFNSQPTMVSEEKRAQEREYGKKVLTYNSLGYLYKYQFSKGQRASRNLMKELRLQPGDYIISIQIEHLEEFHGDHKLVINIFSSGLLNIRRTPKIQDFLLEVYKQLIVGKVESAKAIDFELFQRPLDPNFTFSDLREKPNGSDNLLIIQYFLKPEKTYLQMLWNRSENRKWRQRLVFKLENMMFRSQHEDEKVDLVLNPGDQHLLIIQQIRCQPIVLEGGDGVCTIEILEDIRKR